MVHIVQLSKTINSDWLYIELGQTTRLNLEVEDCLKLAVCGTSAPLPVV